MAYATEADLVEYLGVSEADLPTDAGRLLERASEDIDYWTLGRATQSEATKLAACAQVEMWLEFGEESSIRGPLQSFTLGRWSATYGSGSGGSGPRDLAPRARRYLFTAGLLYRGVAMR